MLRSVDINRCRIVRDQTVEYDSVNDCTDVVNLMHTLGYADATEEYFMLFCLDTHCGVVGVHEISHGVIDSTTVNLRGIFQRAVLNNAASIIVAHNHPSNSALPSDTDIETTKHIDAACRLMEIPLLDHIIVTSDDYTSLAQEGLV